jgi:hypothetical protein
MGVMMQEIKSTTASPVRKESIVQRMDEESGWEKSRKRAKRLNEVVGSLIWYNDAGSWWDHEPLGVRWRWRYIKRRYRIERHRETLR